MLALCSVCPKADSSGRFIHALDKSHAHRRRMGAPDIQRRRVDECARGVIGRHPLRRHSGMHGPTSGLPESANISAQVDNSRNDGGESGSTLRGAARRSNPGSLRGEILGCFRLRPLGSAAGMRSYALLSRHARHRVSPSASPMTGSSGHPVRCGFSTQAQLPLEYWIARSSRATTTERAAPNCRGAPEF
jgi:hypothetical protein